MEAAHSPTHWHSGETSQAVSDGCGEVLKEEAQAALLLVKNEGSRTTEGMLENTSVLAAVLSMVSVVSLSLLSVLCICCKRKTKVIREEDHTYDLQTFQRGGSIFAVMQSRPVTRTNQIPSTTLDIQEEPSQDAADDQSDYENIKHVVTAAHHTGRLEHTYVSPIPNAVYGNDMVQKDENDADQTMGVYENFFQSLPIIDDEDDYENSEFLQQQEDDELDYVNESRVVHPRGTMPRKHH
ncbi:unnamed protein product [Pleuronectes platessa]|uniref:Linker for activation of T-cells family member 2 n=2 Tax=Pleuronectes platessa TaxID=8262 RepID=A0A9N7ZA10_PLEPL|nr:unnamed protein product [Pleuronectes platessa]